MLLSPQLTNESPATEVIANLANIIKVVEGIGIIYGLRQLWVGRKERREADARSSFMARKAANYQAWQVINSAHGKGGSGGRIDALQDLVANDVSLAGVNLDGAWLEKLAIPGATLTHASLRGTCLIGADLSAASVEAADLAGADLTGGSLRGAFLRGASLGGMLLGAADLRGADLQDVSGWENITSISYANIQGLRNAPAGFVEWARSKGAIENDSEEVESGTLGFSQQFRVI